MIDEKVITDLYNIILDRKNNPEEGSYTSYLLQKGLDKILKKVGEESTEVIIAAKNSNPNELTNELCDLIYHLLVLMVENNVSTESVFDELIERRKKIGNKKADRQEIKNL